MATQRSDIDFDRLSVVVPLFNEASGIGDFHRDISRVLDGLAPSYEILYVNDGSADNTGSRLREIASSDAHVRVLEFTRNFGKEAATTAGLRHATGAATLIIDGDGQHPVSAIPEFYKLFLTGANVVVGRRRERRASLRTRLQSMLFNKIFVRITHTPLDPDSSDFRLISREVREAFNRLPERNRIVRGLMDWLGYEKEVVYYDELERGSGSSKFSNRKLMRLAIDSAISLSSSPLHYIAYIGMATLFLSTFAGLFIGIDFVASDPLHLHVTGGGYFVVLLAWLVSILLTVQGVIGLYLAHIHSEVLRRPIYILGNYESDEQL